MTINFLLPHYGYKPSGGFRVVYLYANEFAKYGHTVNLIHAAYCKKGFRRNLFALIETWIGRNSRSNWFEFESNVNIMYTSSLREKNIPDADVTIATAYETVLWLKQYSDKKGKKIYFIQGLETWADSEDAIINSWKTEQIRKIVISKYLLSIGEKNGIFDLTYIPNAIDRSKYRIYNDYKNRSNLIAMVYSSSAVKGAKYGLQAIKEIKKAYADMTVVMFGKEKRPTDFPEWIEYVENPEQEFIIQQIYNKAKIFVCSSLSEGWGLPPMEAMACGAAVVTTDCGGVRDFAIPDQTAIVCSVRDAEGIKAGVQKLLNNERLRIQLVENALKKIEEFDWEDNTRKFINVLEQ